MSCSAGVQDALWVNWNRRVYSAIETLPSKAEHSFLITQRQDCCLHLATPCTYIV